MKRLVALAAAAVCALAATAAVTAPASATDDVPCTWTLVTPATYKIGAAQPKLTVTGSCASTPLSGAGPNNWKLVVDVRHGTTLVPAAGMTFQACDLQYKGKNTDGSASLTMCRSVAANPDFPWRLTLPLKITVAGTYATAANQNSYAYDKGDVNGYATSFTGSTVTAKYATLTSLRIKRVGTTRTFTVYPRHYRVGTGYVHSTRTTVYLQRYVSGRWSTFKKLSSTKYPIVVSARPSSAYRWRAYTPATATCWSSVSPATARI